MIILKFGGTSVNTKERIETLCTIVKKELGRQPIVVVSALRGVTDLLLALPGETPAKQKSMLKQLQSLHLDLLYSILGETDSHHETYIPENITALNAVIRQKPKDKKLFSDEIVSYGELLSSYIIAKALNKAGMVSQQVKATDVIITDSNFGAAEFMPHRTQQKAKKVLLPLIETNIVPVVTGFVGADESGRTTTLGRGGSDYSAAILGYALNASEIQIWTDVAGIFSADPRFVATARPIPAVSFREASELATFGAKILHPRTIRPAVTTGIPVRVLSTLHPDDNGTLIKDDLVISQRALAVAAKSPVTLVNLYSAEMLLTKGFLKRIFTVFEKNNISIDLVSVSEVSVSVTLDNVEQLDAAIQELSSFTTVTVRQMGMVSLIGEGIVHVPHIMRDIFLLLDTAGIPVQMISLGASEINISFIVNTAQVEEAVWLLHQKIIRQLSNSERSYI